jgi:hypothetical protein
MWILLKGCAGRHQQAAWQRSALPAVVAIDEQSRVAPA